VQPMLRHKTFAYEAEHTSLCSRFHQTNHLIGSEPVEPKTLIRGARVHQTSRGTEPFYVGTTRP
jgi:hypothetical protein